MNRDAGLCRTTCTFSRSTRRAEALVDERAKHGQEQRHEERRRAALARHVAERHHQAPVGQRQHVVEVAAYRVGRPRHARDDGVTRFVIPAG
jgi:hypothetical protein